MGISDFDNLWDEIIKKKEKTDTLFFEYKDYVVDFGAASGGYFSVHIGYGQGHDLIADFSISFEHDEVFFNIMKTNELNLKIKEKIKETYPQKKFVYYILDKNEYIKMAE